MGYLRTSFHLSLHYCFYTNCSGDLHNQSWLIWNCTYKNTASAHLVLFLQWLIGREPLWDSAALTDWHTPAGPRLFPLQLQGFASSCCNDHNVEMSIWFQFIDHSWFASADGFFTARFNYFILDHCLSVTNPQRNSQLSPDFVVVHYFTPSLFLNLLYPWMSNFINCFNDFYYLFKAPLFPVTAC